MVNENLPRSQATRCALQASELEEQASAMMRESAAIYKLAKRGSEACVRLKEVLSDPLCGPEVIQQAMDNFNQFYASALSRTHALYEAVTKPNIACGLCNPRDVQRENYDAFAEEIEGVFAFAEDGKLFIKLPLLPAKVNHGVRGKLQGNTEKYYYFFNRSLDESLNKIEAQIPHFEQQNIAYFSVFSVSSKAIPDAENIDTKSVTDIICLHTMCDDSFEKTSFFYAGFCDDSLPSGTYICVSNRRFQVPNISHILGSFRGRKTY